MVRLGHQLFETINPYLCQAFRLGRRKIGPSDYARFNGALDLSEWGSRSRGVEKRDDADAVVLCSALAFAFVTGCGVARADPAIAWPILVGVGRCGRRPGHDREQQPGERTAQPARSRPRDEAWGEGPMPHIPYELNVWRDGQRVP